MFARVLHLILCLLLAGPLSVPGRALARPETRVGGSPDFSPTFTSHFAPQVAEAHQGNVPCGYDFASAVHKYLYAHGDPVNGIDPSGNFELRSTIVTVAAIAVLATVYVTAIHPYVKSARRTIRLNTLQAESGDLSEDDRQIAIESLKRYWPNHEKIGELVQRLEEGALHVRVIRRDSSAARHLLSGTQVFIPQEALDQNDDGRALAILIFGEYQHSPVSGNPILGEAEAQREFEQVRKVLRDQGRTTPFIEAYDHGAH